ncbi:MAG: serine/threonine protein kinase [Planctomycetota bacterium]|nr:serine/threonine protein kinase [Planctomycetota bacterium]
MTAPIDLEIGETKVPSPPTVAPVTTAGPFESSWSPMASSQVAGIWRLTLAGDTPPPLVNLREGEDSSESEETAVRPTNQTSRYQILGEIARGGMGAVLRGRDCELNRDLAVKVLLDKYRDNADVLRRFFEEAQIGGQLQHPGIVPIYDLGIFPDKSPFFAMKLVKGRTLAVLLKERSSPADGLPRFLSIYEQIAQTIAYAHSKNVIHRDLKPPNVMVGAFGEVQVMDWGLAKVLTPEGTPHDDLPHAGTMMSLIETARSKSDPDCVPTVTAIGTPAYMAPEQARAEINRVAKPADVFGLGAMLCEILTGYPAYTGRTLAEVARKTEFADLTDARSRLDACGADPELIDLAKSCLAIEPIDRPRDAGEIATKVTAHLAGVQERLRASELARVDANARAEAERTRRKMTAALASTIVIAVFATGGAWISFRLDRDARIAESDRIVGDALATAKVLQAEAERVGPESVEAWARAHDAADRAKGLLAARPARRALARDVNKTYEAIARSAAAARDLADQIEADGRLVAEVEEARLLGADIKDGSFDLKSRIMAYARAFRRVGIRFGKQPAGEIAARLKTGRDRPKIAAALDDWAFDEPDAARKADILQVAESIDPERNALREALRRGNRAALIAWAADSTTPRLAPATVTLLARHLGNLGAQPEAIGLLSAAQLISPGDFWINHDLGSLLYEIKPDCTGDAERFLSIAVALRPHSSGARYALGLAHHKQGRHDEAAAAFRYAIRIRPELAEAHDSLGHTLLAQGRHEEAAEAFRDAIRIRPGYARSYCKLGHLSRNQGRFDEASAESRTRDGLGSRPPWRTVFAPRIADRAALASLNARLPALLRGNDQPKDNVERLTLGQLCYDLKWFAASSRFWGEALADDPKMSDGLAAGVRYNAARSAAMAGVGRGEDNPIPDEAARASLRRRSREWLRVELSACKTAAQTAGAVNREMVVETLGHWKIDPDFTGVRDEKELVSLPEAERNEWRALWADVDVILAAGRAR